MITKDTLIPYILTIEPSFEQFCEEQRKYWGIQSVHRDMASFSIFIEESIKKGTYDNAFKVFNAIEYLLTETNADQEVKNAVCTSFLENLMNYHLEGSILAESFIPLLGPKSREYCKSWDEFTGVKTPGLWEAEEPNFSRRYNVISDAEAISMIKAIKNHEYSTQSEEEEKIKILSAIFPSILNLLFYDPRKLTPEQILDELKKSIPK